MASWPITKLPSKNTVALPKAPLELNSPTKARLEGKKSTKERDIKKTNEQTTRLRKKGLNHITKDRWTGGIMFPKYIGKVVIFGFKLKCWNTAFPEGNEMATEETHFILA